jgi:hypothetical protein
MKTPNAFAAAYAKLPQAVRDLPGQTKMFDGDPVGPFNTVKEAIEKESKDFVSNVEGIRNER